MNAETLAIEIQEAPETQRTAEAAPEQTTEITPLTFESFRLIGGGSSAVVI